MFNFTRALIRSPKSTLGCLTNRVVNLTSPTSAELKSNNQIENVDVVSPVKSKRSKNMVAAAFASLNGENESNSDLKTPFTDNRIGKASTVDDLLSISDGAGISRQHALKVVSTLADWSSAGKIKLADFEADPRFIKLCKLLMKTNLIEKGGRINNNRSEDLSTIMSVTADDEAAKLVASITVPQMVKVMQSLAMKKRRSTMLLRSLAFNLTRNKEKLDLKQCADLLYSMAVLNFPDENLLERIGNDVVASLDDSLKKSAVVGSILTSLGLLRYKDEVGILDALCTWVLKNQEICRPQDIFALFQTIAVLNFEPANASQLYETLIPQMASSDSHKPALWLDFVWSLVLLNEAKPEHVSSVLSEEFLKEVEVDHPLSISSKMKLLNVNAAACNLFSLYSGPKIDPESGIFKLTLARTKEKEEFVSSVLDSLKNLMPSDKFITTNINTGMGFYIDAECILDKKCSPILKSSYNPSEHTKVAIMIQEYHDMCRGRVEPTGMNMFVSKLLETRDYKILHIPYYEYKLRDKLVHRVQYLEKKLKSIVKS